MIEQIKDMIVGVLLAVLAYLRPIEGELWSLFLVFALNFLFGYLSGMIANKEDFQIKKALRCVGEATAFFVLCMAIYVIGRLKGQMGGATQCVSFVVYLVLYFYGLNILKNFQKMLKKGTAPEQVVGALYWVLRFKFIEKVPFLSEYLNMGGGEEGEPSGKPSGTTPTTEGEEDFNEKGLSDNC